MSAPDVREAAEALLYELDSLALPRVNADVKVKDGFPCFYCGTPLDPDLRDRRDEPHTAFCPWKIAMQSAHALRAALAAPVSPPAPRGEAVVGWIVLDGDNIPRSVPFDLPRRADAEKAATNPTDRVVALVPRESPSEEPAT